MSEHEGTIVYQPLPVREIVKRFEVDFRAGLKPRIQDYLQGDAAARQGLLFELIHSELELRLTAGEKARVRDYLKELSELEAWPNELLVLVETEVRLRHADGEQLELSEYLSSYPGQAEGLRKLFVELENAPPQIDGFEKLTEIGHGAMGKVYRARQLAPQREVAIKFIAPARLAVPEIKARFVTESNAMARVSHPNVVQVYQAGESSQGPYLVMEFIDGPSLLAKLGQPGVLEANEAARLLEVIARAMHVVHERGIIHRDLKPSNILLTASGVPKVSDFGLAKHGDDPTGTLAGQALGTPAYMAPEQIKDASRVGPPADVYSLGAVLYHCLVGKPPFQAASSAETIRRVLDDEPPSLRRLQRDVPRDLETVCLKCLEKEPGRRYGSAEELADDLRRFLDHRPIVARPATSRERAWKWVRRNRAVAALAASVLVVALVATAGGGWLYGQMGIAQVKEQLSENKAKSAEERTTSANQAKVDAEQRSNRLLQQQIVKQAAAAWRNGDAQTPEFSSIAFHRRIAAGNGDTSTDTSARARKLSLPRSACFPPGRRTLLRCERRKRLILTRTACGRSICLPGF